VRGAHKGPDPRKTRDHLRVERPVGRPRHRPTLGHEPLRTCSGGTRQRGLSPTCLDRSGAGPGAFGRDGCVESVTFPQQRSRRDPSIRRALHMFRRRHAAVQPPRANRSPANAFAGSPGRPSTSRDRASGT
jgi:hypothetical protein